MWLRTEGGWQELHWFRMLSRLPAYKLGNFASCNVLSVVAKAAAGHEVLEETGIRMPALCLQLLNGQVSCEAHSMQEVCL